MYTHTYTSGQIIIFHGSLGRISLFQIWNEVRSQKSRNSKWGRIVMFFQTTENPTVYLPNDPNLVILRNVSWVGGQSLKDLKFDEAFVSMFSFWLSEAPKSHPKRCAFISKQQNPTVFKNCQTTESISQKDIPSRSKWSEADKRSPTTYISNAPNVMFQNRKIWAVRGAKMAKFNGFESRPETLEFYQNG